MWYEIKMRQYRDKTTGQPMNSPIYPQKPKEMTDKVITIDVPEGYEIDKDKSTFEKIVFKSLNVCKNPLPKMWADLYSINGYYVDTFAQVYSYEFTLAVNGNRNVWPSKAEAYAALALAQLCQLRDRYNDGWKPDWENGDEYKHVIFISGEHICPAMQCLARSVLAFKTIELRDEFLDNFRDLIEKAKPLL
jgi:hypothetical protein